MRSGVVYVFVLSLFVFTCFLQAGNSALLPENLLVIDRGPVFFSREKAKQSFEFEVTAQNLENCRNIFYFVGLKSGIEGKKFSISKSLNGKEFGGSSTPLQRWHIGGGGLDLTRVKAGKNRIDIEAILEDWDKSGNVTYEGCVGGIVIYFSKEKGEDVGLLDYINYGEPETSKPEEEGEEKSNCWVTGIIHTHTTNSDGSYSVEARAKQIKELGHYFMIVEDHFVQIDKPIKAPGTYYKNAGEMAKSKVGFTNYVKSCRAVTSDGHFVAVAGAEFNTPWHSDNKTACFAHTLCLGSIQKTDALTKIQGKEGKQAELIAAINSIGLSVAAHPNLVSSRSASIRPWEDVRFKYDTSSPEKYAGLDGVEIGNSDSSEQDEADMNFFMTLMKDHHPAFPTGGCDSHGWGDKEDDERMQRLTGVYIENLTENGLLKAVKEGHVWASTEGVKIVDCDPVPGFAVQLLDRANFSFTLAGLPNKVKCQMYRNGEPVSESILVVSPESPVYNWSDENCPEKETWYNFRVLPNFLVTAPIIIRLGD